MLDKIGIILHFEIRDLNLLFLSFPAEEGIQRIRIDPRFHEGDGEEKRKRKSSIRDSMEVHLQ